MKFLEEKSKKTCIFEKTGKAQKTRGLDFKNGVLTLAGQSIEGFVQLSRRSGFSDMIVRLNDSMLHIHFAAYKFHSFARKLFPLRYFPAKGIIFCQTAVGVHHAVTGKFFGIGIFVKNLADDAGAFTTCCLCELAVGRDAAAGNFGQEMVDAGGKSFIHY